MSKPRLEISSRLIAVVLCLLLIAGSALGAEKTAQADDANSFEQTLQPFLEAHCLSCHGEDEQEGDRRFDKLSKSIANGNDLVDYEEILDQLQLGRMPPKDEKQPTSAERRRVTSWLVDRVEKHQIAHNLHAGETVLRRLNSREYRNTLRDLLGLNMSMYDPTATFPREREVDHLDNVGDTLVTSGYLLSQYLTAAEQSVQKALLSQEQPKPQTWKFDDNFRQQPEIDQVHGKTNGFSYITLYDVPGADKHEGAYAPIHEFRQGVPTDGYYEISFQAEAVNRDHPYDDAFIGTDRTEPLRLGIVPGNSKVGPLHHTQPIEPLLAEFELDDAPQRYTVRVWLDAGHTPRFTFPNGLMDARNLWSKLVRKYPDQFPKPKDFGIVEMRYLAIKHGKLPQIHVDDIEITGPHYDTWPTASQKSVLGDDCETILKNGKFAEGEVRKQIESFARRAFRRPAIGDEVDRLVGLFESQRAAGRNEIEAYGDALTAVLCSPSFLYLDEGGRGDQLSQHALASRLSYFLWASMPDDELLAAADRGGLNKPEVLEAHVERMLNDPRSDSFVSGFLESWLTLDDLGSMPPDRVKFSDYYRFDLQAAMRRETEMFTRHLLDENKSVIHFVDADFTFANRPLAKFYGAEPPAKPKFAQVALNDNRRGGLLGQASVLTVTANGIDTSPVLRGTWVLENIFGRRPSPPPPDVEPLDPDIRGAVTIRDQLEKHRASEACADCHRSIDPLGFALENFDAIGRWRSSYGKGLPIDASGELEDGGTFQDIRDFKSHLKENPDRFTRTVTRKLLAYSLGRQLTPADNEHVEAIADEAQKSGNGFRDLVKQVVLSELFSRS
ncbi:MAG: DUF1592 domain-containing protein [Planctomycetaceae bacterium]